MYRMEHVKINKIFPMILLNYKTDIVPQKISGQQSRSDKKKYPECSRER